MTFCALASVASIVEAYLKEHGSTSVEEEYLSEESDED